MDSGWVAIGVLAGVVVVVAALMIGVSLAAEPADDRLQFAGDELSFAYPPDWILAPGDAGPAEHRVIAHLVTFAVEPDELCTTFADPCQLSGSAIPPGEASIEITSWQGGTPPVPDPVTARTFGLDADAIIGGNPAAFELREVAEDSVVAWWQLSPPGFPDRWIEVRAEVAGQEIERAHMLGALGALMASLEFVD